MKKVIILLGFAFIAIGIIGCKKEHLHADEIIRKHNLIYYPYWDSEKTPFRKNATIYANKETDSCLLILQNKEGDTILCHLDKSIVTITNLRYEKNHDDWIIKKSDFGKTVYDLDSIGDWYGSISGSNSNNLPIDEFYTIDRQKKKFKRIKPISKKELLDKIASKFRHLKKCTIAALNNTTTYVFKDTLKDKQVLYQLETKYNVEYKDGKYVIVPKFESASRNEIFKNRVFSEKGGNTMYFGEKIFYGKNSWDFNFRYEIDVRKYYKFQSRVKGFNNSPGIEVFKTEALVYDWKNKTNKIIKDFPKDSLFEDYNFGFQEQLNGKIYVGINTGDDCYDFYYELDTIQWKLINFDEPTTGRIPRH